MQSGCGEIKVKLSLDCYVFVQIRTFVVFFFYLEEMGAESKSSSKKESKHAIFVGGFFGASAKELEKVCSFVLFFCCFFLADYFSSLACMET